MTRAAVAAVALVLLAHPAAGAEYRGTDILGNISGGSGAHGTLMDRYPLQAYMLDVHIDSSVLPGNSWGAEAAAFLTSVLWSVSLAVMKLTIGLIALAFNLDLLDRQGALQPIARAIRDVHDRVLGEPWMLVAVVLAGFWVMRKALVQRRHAEAATSVLTSLAFVTVATLILLKPFDTVGEVASWTNRVSVGFLTAANQGTVRDPAAGKAAVTDQIFEAQVLKPWVVLNFGGLTHCVSAQVDKDGFPLPVNPDDSRARTCRDHLRAQGGWGGYAPRFLSQQPGSDERDAEYQALANGAIPDASGPNAVRDCPRGDCSKSGTRSQADVDRQFAGYRVSKADSPAVDIQQEGGAYMRLLLALLILAVTLLAAVFLGGLAALIILTQAVALVILGFAPLMVILALIPGRGHGLFVEWATKLFQALVIKAAYSLLISVVLAVNLALLDATATLGWLFAFGLQGILFAALIAKRKVISGAVVSSREHHRAESYGRRAASFTAAAVAAPVSTLASVQLAGKAKDRTEKQESAVSPTPQPAPGGPVPPPPSSPTPKEASVPIRPFKEDLEWERDARYRQPAASPEDEPVYRAEPVPVENMQQSLDRARAARVARALSERANGG